MLLFAARLQNLRRPDSGSASNYGACLCCVVVIQIADFVGVQIIAVVIGVVKDGFKACET